MEKWDEELVAACASYPNMRVYDWASDVKDDWFIEDGIHFTSPGYAARAQLIAQALAHAFPEKGETEGGSKNCVVSECSLWRTPPVGGEALDRVRVVAALRQLTRDGDRSAPRPRCRCGPRAALWHRSGSLRRCRG